MKGGNKKKRLLLTVGALAALILPGMVVYMILSLLHRAQDGLVVSHPRSTASTLTYTEATTNRTITANSHRDFGAVCGGFTIKNAAAFTDKHSAIIVTFSQSPRTKDSWSYEDIGYGKTYTTTDGDFTKINTVACLHEIRDTKVFARACSYSQDGVTVPVKYYSIRYKLAYYEAKTGKRITDGGIVEAPAGECPGFVAYDDQSLTAYATPENEVIDVAHTNFVSGKSGSLVP